MSKLRISKSITSGDMIRRAQTGRHWFEMWSQQIPRTGWRLSDLSDKDRRQRTRARLNHA
jgi:hypothetical protein